MGNKEKRAKRSKLKAKNARVQKQNKRSIQHDQGSPLPPETIEMFKTLPSPEMKSDCLSSIEDYLLKNSDHQFDDIEASTEILFAMYSQWHSSNA